MKTLTLIQAAALAALALFGAFASAEQTIDPAEPSGATVCDAAGVSSVSGKCSL